MTMKINRERGATFARYVGLELKGAIVARGFTAKAVARNIDRGDANLNRWLNGKIEIPVSVACEVAEAIGIEPSQIVQTAYDRMVVEMGELDGTTYEETAPTHLRALDVPAPEDTVDVVEAPDLDALPHAAKRGIRKADAEPHAE